jgi:hypothetical protein
VVGGLRADVNVVFDDLHVAPRGAACLSGQPAEVDQRAIALDLDEGGAVSLADGGKLTARRGGPSWDGVLAAGHY